jgi:O-antigen ligase
VEDRSHPLALLDLALALLAGALWYARPELGPWPLILLGAGLIARLLVEPRPEFRLTGMDAAVGLCALGAGLGLAVAYDWGAALQKFWAIIGGIGIYGAFSRAPDAVRFVRRTVRPVPTLLAALPAFIAVYFLVTADFGLVEMKAAPFNPVYRLIESLRPRLPIDAMHSNVAGGLIAFLLPLQVFALRGRRTGWILIAISLAGLLLSASRGAWAALAAVAAAWGLAALAGSGRKRAAAVGGVALILLLAAAIAAPALLAGTPAPPAGTAAVAQADENPPTAASLPATVDAGDGGFFADAQGRLSLYRQSLSLAWDYAFTGLGLGGFPMAFSSYLLLVHVGHTAHSHNLYLDAWLEMGLPGLAAVLWLGVAALVAARRVFRLGDAIGRGWAAAALASVGVLFLHGLIDDPLFSSHGVLFMFIPFAILGREQALAVWQDSEPPATLADVLRTRAGLIVAGLLAVALLVALLPPVRSQAQANLGALEQTRAELALYNWPAWSIQDALRRSPAVDLDPALRSYATALAIDAGNTTANRRLGQMLMSRGEYDAAGPLLAAAYRNDAGNRAARQLYGEWLAISGREQEAAAIWRTIDTRQGQLDARAWWHDSIGESDQAEAIRRAQALR